MNMFRNRRKSWIEHVLRGKVLLKEVIEVGKMVKGRPRIEMLDEVTNESHVDMKRKTEDREASTSCLLWTCHWAVH